MKNPDIITPPDQSGSMLLNGASTGASIGILPGAVLELYHFVAKKPIATPKTMTLIFAGGAALGTALGAVFSIQESKDLANYRNAVSKDCAPRSTALPHLPPSPAEHKK